MHLLHFLNLLFIRIQIHPSGTESVHHPSNAFLLIVLVLLKKQKKNRERKENHVEINARIIFWFFFLLLFLKIHTDNLTKCAENLVLMFWIWSLLLLMEKVALKWKMNRTYVINVENESFRTHFLLMHF